MSYLGRVPWDRLEQWRAMTFIIAGLLFLTTSALTGLETFTAATHPTWLTVLFGLSGLVASFVGLAGFYPRLADRKPRLARAGIVTLAMAGVALIAFPLCQMAKTSGVNLPIPPMVMYLIAMIGTMLGFLLFGAASLHTRIPSRSVGLLMMGTVTTFIVLFAADLLYAGSPAWLDFAVNGLQAILLLTIGFVLPTSSIPTEYGEPQTDIMSG